MLKLGNILKRHKNAKLSALCESLRFLNVISRTRIEGEQVKCYAFWTPSLDERDENHAVAMKITHLLGCDSV